MTSHYDTLGLPESATNEQIKERFRALSKVHHPDVDKSAGAAERFILIREAYAVLKDPDERNKHDFALARFRTTGVAHDPMDSMDTWDDIPDMPIQKHKKRKHHHQPPPAGTGKSASFEDIGPGFEHGKSPFDWPPG